MGSSGYIDWHRLDTTIPWVRCRTGEHTYVYAFWLADYGRNPTDHGVSLLKGEAEHPDWFVHASTGDHVLTAYTPPGTIVSPNAGLVFAGHGAARPLLAGVMLGSVDCIYRTTGGMWWASEDDLTRRGKRLLKNLNELYLREPVLVTFVDAATDGNGGSRDPG